MTCVLLGIDGSLRGTAWLAIDLLTEEPIDAGTHETINCAEPEHRALGRVLDDARCGRVIRRGIARVVHRYSPIAIALEAPLGSQDAIASAHLARANQAVVDGIDEAAPTLFEQRRVSFVSSYYAKWASTGSKKPERAKQDVRAGVSKRWGRDRMAQLAACAQSDAGVQGVYDAGAVVMLALKLPHVIALRNELLEAPLPPPVIRRPTVREEIIGILKYNALGNGRGELDATIALSAEYCGLGCPCPAGRCWYDEQLVRRGRVEPALTPIEWSRRIELEDNASAKAGGGD